MTSTRRARQGKIIFTLTDAQHAALLYYAKERRRRRGKPPPYRTTSTLIRRGLIDCKDAYNHTHAHTSMAAHWLLKALHALEDLQP